ncbi:RNA polymerase sigma factor [Petrocella sp. FN5]|uniref:RNA polymerase sigma factor n=1 Tax=Petrocella sp. FN5 TaxID=3032002 RepID=UPI0023D9A22F|nr:RNA polymerase sigma factor [Petrocella sp. FN5]MDF1618625.1 RNA polymerase sigma factor [Petrocella sp. FN5]
MLAFLILLDTNDERSEFDKLYENYHMMVYRAAYSVLKDKYLAQDAAQISFIKIAKKFNLIHSKNILDERAYIYRLTLNTAKDMLDKEQCFMNVEETFLSNIIDEQSMTELSIIQIENHKETLALLDEINPSYGEIIYLKYFREFENDEIGILLDLTSNAVRVKLHRALNALREVTKKEVLFNER